MFLPLLEEQYNKQCDCNFLSIVINTSIIIHCMYETIFISIAAYYYKPEHVKDQGNKQKCSYHYLKSNIL